MTRVAIIAIALTCFAQTASARVSPDFMKRTLTRTWYGVSQAPANFTKSGKVVLSHRVTIHRFTSASRFVGTSYTTFRLDGRKYYSTVSIEGTINPRTHRVTTRTVRYVRSDRLPRGLRWCHSSGSFELYRDARHRGHYLLKGSGRSTCGGNGTVQLSTRPVI